MYPCADGATPLPGICGWRQILCPANFVDVVQEAIETGLSSILPPAVRHHRLPPKLLPDRLLASSDKKIDVKDGPAAGGPPGLQAQRPTPGLQGPPGLERPLLKASSLHKPPRSSGVSRSVQDPRASRIQKFSGNFRGLPSVSDHPRNGWERSKQAGWEFRV